MTPLEFAQSLAHDLEISYGSQLVSPYTAQLGDLVVDCPGTFVTLLSLSEQDLGGNCGSIPMADVVVAEARDCAFVANEDGTTDHAKMDQVSQAMDHDAVLLQEAADKWFAASWFRLAPPTITFLVQGGLSTVLMNVSLPVP